MSIAFHRTQKTIRFVIWGSLCQSITDWELRLDELVFNEQLNTGSFRGRFPVTDDLIIQFMRRSKEQGKIAPYYGAGGSRGSCAYLLQKTTAGFRIRVENTTVKEGIDFLEHDFRWLRGPLLAHFLTWLAVYAQLGRIPSPYMILPITGKALHNLRTWKNWQEMEAATGRYIYRFGQVSLGASGFTNRVTDMLSGETVDATPYDTW